MVVVVVVNLFQFICLHKAHKISFFCFFHGIPVN